MKGVLILAVMILGVLLTLPTFVKMPDVKWLPKNPVKLGLDLQGGMHLVLQVDTSKALENRLGNTAAGLKDQLIKKRIPYAGIVSDKDAITINFRSVDDREKAKSLIRDEEATLVQTDLTEGGFQTLKLSMNPADVQKFKESVRAQAVETIRNRVDQFGVAEPSIVPEGEDRIALQLPGIDNPERAKQLIGKTAILEFKLVDEEHPLDAALAGDIPLGSELVYQKDGSSPLLLKKQAVLSGDMLDDAKMSIGGGSPQPYVSLTFTKEGGRRFEQLTAENVGKRLAIVLDGKIHSAPVIKSAISGGKAVIEGSFSDDEAGDLAIVLRAGALPAPVNFAEERTVGPSLGKDSIHQGLIASAVGLAAIAVFCMVYYGLSGVLAVFALVCNVFLILGLMSLFKATLTMPGIGGIALTIGMAVDTNVIIYERIREELRLGRTVKMAVEAGYHNAFSTILDSNLTTLISGLVLFAFGTGPIKGFAVTLSLGIATSLFTALVMCKWLMFWFVNSRKLDKLSI
jgi:preprotein translocase subunit SecD